VFENTFYSSYPEVQIKIGSEFNYIGETKEAKTRQARDSTYTGTIRTNWYLFVQAEERRVKKSVSIEIQKAPTYFVSDIYGRVKNFYDRGTCELGGVNWQYCSSLVYLNYSRPVTRFLADKGYVIPNCLLMKSFSKVYGPKGDHLITISYLEVPPTSDYACHRWKPNSDLADSQREYIEQFKKNYETAFVVLKVGF